MVRWDQDGDALVKDFELKDRALAGRIDALQFGCVSSGRCWTSSRRDG
jgi:hypothetical protein